LQKAFGLAVGFANKDIYVSMVRLVADVVGFERSVPARGCSWLDVDVVGAHFATTWQWS